jgi:hypothetical protein
MKIIIKKQIKKAKGACSFCQEQKETCYRSDVIESGVVALSENQQLEWLCKRGEYKIGFFGGGYTYESEDLYWFLKGGPKWEVKKTFTNAYICDDCIAQMAAELKTNPHETKKV